MASTLQATTQAVTVLRTTGMRQHQQSRRGPHHSPQRRPDLEAGTAELSRHLSGLQLPQAQPLHRRGTPDGARRHRCTQAQTHGHLKEHEHHAPSHRVNEQSLAYQRAVSDLDGWAAPAVPACQPLRNPLRHNRGGDQGSITTIGTRSCKAKGRLLSVRKTIRKLIRKTIPIFPSIVCRVFGSRVLIAAIRDVGTLVDLG